MYAASFSYIRPTSLPEALEQLAHAGHDAKLIAGGQSLVPLLRLRFARPALLVDISRLDALRFARADSADLWLGALTTESQLLALDVGPSCLALTDAARVIADPLVRNRGTIGGNIAHADPANDLPAVLSALDATALVESAAGTRDEKVSTLFVGPMTTTLAPDDVITGFRVPVVPGAGSAYVKIERQAGDYAIAAAAVWLQVEEARVVRARVALTNAGPIPVQSPAAADALVGGTSWSSGRDDAANAAAAAAEFGDDLRGGVAYKRAVARRAVAQALEIAKARAEASA